MRLMSFLLMMGMSAPALANPYGPTLLEAPVPDGDPFSWSVEPLVLHPGSEGRLELRLVIPPGTHVYRDQVDVTVIDDGGLQVGRMDLPPGELAEDPASKGSRREQFATDAIIYLPVRAPKRFAAPSAILRLSLRHQGCREGLCFPPATTEETVLVPVRTQEQP